MISLFLVLSLLFNFDQIALKNGGILLFTNKIYFGYPSPKESIQLYELRIGKYWFASKFVVFGVSGER